MPVQPFILVTIQEGEKSKEILINESHVATVDRGENGEAILGMSSGREVVVLYPDYEGWKDDTYVRKQ